MGRVIAIGIGLGIAVAYWFLGVVLLAFASMGDCLADTPAGVAACQAGKDHEWWTTLRWEVAVFVAIVLAWFAVFSSLKRKAPTA